MITRIGLGDLYLAAFSIIKLIYFIHSLLMQMRVFITLSNTRNAVRVGLCYGETEVGWIGNQDQELRIMYKTSKPD